MTTTAQDLTGHTVTITSKDHDMSVSFVVDNHVATGAGFGSYLKSPTGHLFYLTDWTITSNEVPHPPAHTFIKGIDGEGLPFTGIVASNGETIMAAYIAHAGTDSSYATTRQYDWDEIVSYTVLDTP